MNTITLSPLQSDHVTKSEFNKFCISTNKRFESIDRRFEAIDKRFESIDKRFDDIDKKFKEQRKLLNEDYERHTGMILEQTDHRLKLAVEQMRHELDKKIDREEFYLFMDGFTARIFEKIDSLRGNI